MGGGGAGREGGLHWGCGVCVCGGGHQCTAAKLMPFFLCSGTEKQSVVAYWQRRIQEVKMDLSILGIICYKGGEKKKQKTSTLCCDLMSNTHNLLH